MPIQIPATIVAAQTATATTRIALVDFIKAQCVLAGWAVISGASGDWVLQSGAFNGNQCRVRIYESGVGTNCARITIRRIDDSQAATTDIFLLPGNDWRIIAYPMQFVAWRPGASAGREFGLVSALFTDSNILGANVISLLGQCNATSDVEAAVRDSFRTKFALDDAYTYVNYQGLFRTQVGGNSDNGGYPSLVVPRARHSNAFVNGKRWKNDAFNIVEPLVSWGTEDLNLNNSEGKIAGQLWGGFVDTESTRVTDSTVTYPVAGRTYRTVGQGAAPSAQYPVACLLFAET